MIDDIVDIKSFVLFVSDSFGRCDRDPHRTIEILIVCTGMVHDMERMFHICKSTQDPYESFNVIRIMGCIIRMI